MIANKLPQYAFKREKNGEKSALNRRKSQKAGRNGNRSHSIVKTIIATAKMK